MRRLRFINQEELIERGMGNNGQGIEKRGYPFKGV
jgi:hypothetical protein